MRTFVLAFALMLSVRAWAVPAPATPTAAPCDAISADFQEATAYRDRHCVHNRIHGPLKDKCWLSNVNSVPVWSCADGSTQAFVLTPFQPANTPTFTSTPTDTPTPVNTPTETPTP